MSTGTLWHKIALTTVASIVAGIGITSSAAAASPAPTATPSVCVNDFSGYYCFYTGTNRSTPNGHWVEDNCWSNNWKSMPTNVRDDVRSWDHRQSSGVYILAGNYIGNGQYTLEFTMVGQTYESNQPDEGAAGADSILNHC